MLSMSGCWGAEMVRYDKNGYEIPFWKRIKEEELQLEEQETTKEKNIFGKLMDFFEEEPKLAEETKKYLPKEDYSNESIMEKEIKEPEEDEEDDDDGDDEEDIEDYDEEEEEPAYASRRSFENPLSGILDFGLSRPFKQKLAMVGAIGTIAYYCGLLDDISTLGLNMPSLFGLSLLGLMLHGLFGLGIIWKLNNKI